MGGTPHPPAPVSARLAAPRTGPGPAPPWWASTLLSLAAGTLLGSSYQPYGLWFAAPLGVGLLCWLSRQPRMRRVVWTGFAAGLVLYAMTVSFEYVVDWWLPLLLVPVLALWVVLTAVLQHFAQYLRLWPVWSAAAWIAAEAGAQRFPLGGFAWDRLGFTTADAPLGGYLWVLGTAGTGFAVALVGTGLLAAVDAARAAGHRLGRTTAVLVPVALIITGGGALRAVPVQDPDQGEVTIAVVQGDVDGSAGPRTSGYARSVTNNHVSETIMAMARARTGIDPAPDLVLWPENSTDMDPNSDQRTRELIERAQAIAGVPILVGAVTDGPGTDERQTTALWWTADGETDRYAKRNAVPFGEYTPMKDLVFRLVPMARQVGRQTVPGAEPGVIEGDLDDGRRLSVGDMICYELAFDSTVYDTERYGGQVMTVQSNNATYSGTAQPLQQFTITRIRAMEMRREIVVSTTSSYSGMIGADGRVIARSTPDTAYARSFITPIRSGTTPAMTAGPVLELVGAVLAATSAIAGVAVGRAAGRDRDR
ncbi:apolipoprotein N-acyltransferase [uncultured Propionibacterium sp.]|uniref:apolipoprotein N-acyltransferase n=1 Tax=uncultured Propionibacterium sp. TaxID=218066 RepID=UPI002930FF50|nr:apolipoprotein N-acyltransferase [uncultured Propionibacterium sp.]